MKNKICHYVLGILVFQIILTVLWSCKKENTYPTFIDQGNIGPDGGIVKTSDGASVEIPPDALSYSVAISIANVTPKESDANSSYKKYELKPDRTIFKDSVLITLPIDDENIVLNNQDKNYGIQVFAIQESGIQTFKPEIDIENKVVKIRTTHFSDYFIFFRSQWTDYYEANKSTEGDPLPVPYYAQEGEWCFYYSLGMIAKYTGYQYKGPRLAALFNEKDPDETGYIVGPFKDFGFDELKLKRLKDELGMSYEYASYWTNVKNMSGYILDRIKKNKPVLVLSTALGHAIVVAGHNETGFFINDPDDEPPLKHVTYEVFENNIGATSLFNCCYTLCITSAGNESKKDLTVNFRNWDVWIKEGVESETSQGYLSINGDYKPYGFTILKKNTNEIGSFEGSDYFFIRPEISNSSSTIANALLYIKIDDKNINGSPLTLKISGPCKDYFEDHEPINTRLSNISKGAHRISVELRSEDEQFLYDSWSFDVNIATEFIDNGHPPNLPASPNPSNNATGVSTSPTLTWICTDPDGDPLTYDIYFGTSNNPTTLIATNLTTESISRTGLTQGTTYYWKVVAKDNQGNIIGGNIWSFTTESTPTTLLYENYESYTTGTFPVSWVADGNATDITQNSIVNNTSYSSSRSLKLYGSIGGCWAAIAYHTLNTTAPFEFEVAIRNGNEALSGCNPDRATIGLRQGTYWGNPQRRFLIFDGNGRIYGGGGIDLGSYSNSTWYLVKIKYERTSTTQIRLSYWINNNYVGYESLSAISEESQLNNLEICVLEGSAWFDDIKIYK